VVNISNAFERQSYARVRLDARSDGHMAADYFVGKGFRNFGFFGTRGHGVYALRRRGFEERLRARGFTCATHVPAALAQVGGSYTTAMHRLGTWLAALREPAAVFCASDPHAAHVVDVCGQIGRRIPFDVAVLGVDNDAFICEATTPPLSSIAVDWEEMGYQAARMLEEVMAARRSPPTERLILPLGVVQRRSTDMLEVHSPALRGLLRYVDAHLGEIRRTHDLARRFALSRRTMELAFRRTFNMSPHEFLQTMRMRRALGLLTQPSERRTIKEICYAAGFTDLQQMQLLFRKRLGRTPSQLRSDPAGGRRGDATVTASGARGGSRRGRRRRTSP
jgi:LacI family transcriptional regulator